MLHFFIAQKKKTHRVVFYIHHTDLFIFLHTVQYSNTLVFLQKTLKFLPTLYGFVIFFADIGQKLQY